MCGIAGLLTQRWQDEERLLEAMAERLGHRGPDAQAVWADAGQGIGLAHARLSIRDLSPGGAQPMSSASGRCVIAYNGEIYNAQEMQETLPGHVWRGHSDTEVLLEYCEKFGVEAALESANGIFAFALWDKAQRRLFLARDRFGVKPLYWAALPGRFLFGSELKALALDPALPRDLDEAALESFLRLNHVPAPLTIWKAARKLAPGHVLTVSPGMEPLVERWWSAGDELRRAASLRTSARAIDDLARETEALLEDAVRRQTVSDVPIGAFLSGGVDSSAVAAFLTGGGAPLQTFTVRFQEAAYDEGEDARRVARYLGARHHEEWVTAQGALRTIPDLARIYDEPFADSSQIPTLLISRFAKRHVSVVLSGDGGDEIFAGYNRHRFAARFWPKLAALPRPARRAAAWLLSALPPSFWDRAPTGLAVRQLGEKIQKLAAILPAASLEEAHAILSQQGLQSWESPLASPPASPYLEAPDHTGLDPLDRMQLQDIETYLPNDVLTKVDRASMSCGLEVRVPLLDHRLMRLAFALEPGQRFQDGQGKALLRRALAKRLPAAWFAGKAKMGFALPLDGWLGGPLRDWAEDLLGRLRQDARFDARTIDGWWREHLGGRRKRHHALWPLLMFQAWRDAWDRQTDHRDA